MLHPCSQPGSQKEPSSLHWPCRACVLQMYDDHPEYLGQTAKKSKKASCRFTRLKCVTCRLQFHRQERFHTATRQKLQPYSNAKCTPERWRQVVHEIRCRYSFGANGLTIFSSFAHFSLESWHCSRHATYESELYACCRTQFARVLWNRQMLILNGICTIV